MSTPSSASVLAPNLPRRVYTSTKLLVNPVLDIQRFCPPYIDYHKIGILEEDLVEAIYEQRTWEQEIMSFAPQSSAPSHIIQSFTESKIRVQGIERKIRQLRYSF